MISLISCRVVHIISAAVLCPAVRTPDHPQAAPCRSVGRGAHLAGDLSPAAVLLAHDASESRHSGADGASGLSLAELESLFPGQLPVLHGELPAGWDLPGTVAGAWNCRRALL